MRVGRRGGDDQAREGDGELGAGDARMSSAVARAQQLASRRRTAMQRGEGERCSSSRSESGVHCASRTERFAEPQCESATARLGITLTPKRHNEGARNEPETAAGRSSVSISPACRLATVAGCSCSRSHQRQSDPSSEAWFAGTRRLRRTNARSGVNNRTARL